MFKFSKVLIISVTAWVLLFQQNLVYADLDSNINGFLNNVGFGTNTSNPSVYQGQEMGYLNAGSLVIKTRSDNLQLVGIELPSIKAGCGSIDLFMGGFSFVNSQHLVEFGQEVMMDAIPVAVDLAIQTVSPMLGGITSKLQTWANKINNLNINSCEAAQDLVSGKWAKDIAGQSKACKDQGISDNKFQDWSDAIYGCNTGGNANSETDKAGTNPVLKAHVIKNKNVVWSDVLEASSFLSSDRQVEQVYMSLSGTVIFDTTGKVKTYYTKAGDPALTNALLYGGRAPIYGCDEYTLCLNVADVEQQISVAHGLVNQVSKMINDLHTTYQNDTPLTPQERSFISLCNAPILKMIQDEFSAGIISSGLQQYSEVIAKQLLSVYLEKMMSNISTALSSATMDDASRETIQNSLMAAQKVIRGMSLKSYQTLSAAQIMLTRTLKIAQIGAANLTAKAKQNMKFGAN